MYIPDDPVIRSMEQTGSPPWVQNWHEDELDYEEFERKDEEEDDN